MPSAPPPNPPHQEPARAAPPLRPLRWPVAGLIGLAFILPFLFVRIPPLIDLPGHLVRMAVAAAPANSPLHGYFSFTWAAVR